MDVKPFDYRSWIRDVFCTNYLSVLGRKESSSQIAIFSTILQNLTARCSSRVDYCGILWITGPSAPFCFECSIAYRHSSFIFIRSAFLSPRANSGCTLCVFRRFDLLIMFAPCSTCAWPGVPPSSTSTLTNPGTH